MSNLGTMYIDVKEFLMYDDRKERIEELAKMAEQERINRGTNTRKAYSKELKEKLRLLHWEADGYHGARQYIADKIGMNVNTLSRFGRARVHEKRSTTSFREKGRVKTSTKPLKVNSSSGVGRPIGTTLKTMLAGISDDVLIQSEMVKVLSEAGYKEDEIINCMPTEDNFKEIMKAVNLLSKQYEIKRK